eukprot:s1508_g28.t1
MSSQQRYAERGAVDPDFVNIEVDVVKEPAELFKGQPVGLPLPNRLGKEDPGLEVDDELKAENNEPSDADLVLSARKVSMLSIFISLVLAILGFSIGLSENVLSVLGFGMESTLDGISSALVMWRFKTPKQRQFRDAEAAAIAKEARDARRERNSAVGIGATFVVSAVVLCGSSVWKLFGWDPSTPEHMQEEHSGAIYTSLLAWPSAVWKPVKDLLAELENLVGLGDVKDQMKEIVAQVDFNLQRANLKLPDIGGQSLHMAFLGNPGTGKTVVARMVGELLVAMGAIRSNVTKEDFDLVSEVSRPDLVGEHSGATALKVTKAFDDADGGVLFIDEAYSIVQGDSDSFGREAVDTIIKLMEDRRDRIIVILAGYQKEMSDFVAANPGFKSRIAFSFNFPDYTCPELVKIADRLMKKKKNVALTSDGPTCESKNPPDSCRWLKNAIRLQTGCCETTHCGKEENRANGNGRTVRNILDASYRKMSSRVLTSFTPQLLQEYD